MPHSITLAPGRVLLRHLECHYLVVGTDAFNPLQKYYPPVRQQKDFFPLLWSTVLLTYGDPR